MSADIKGRVLINEDDKVIGTLLSRLLGSKGYQAVHVEKAEDAIQHLQNVGIVISDIDQPASQGGYWLLDQVRGLYPSLPVILMSGLPIEPEQSEGAIARVQKPFDYKELEKLIETHTLPYIRRTETGVYYR